MDRVYRVGIIGLGQIACELPDNHMKAYQDCDHTVISAVCDSKEKTVPFFFPFYKTPSIMVQRENLDIVSVCTPPDTHRDIVCSIAPYVKAIYCEKPIAETLIDAQLMIDVCKHYDTILQINHQRLFVNPVFRFSRGAINTGTHMFSLINHLFKDNIKVDIIEVDTDEPIFELDCTHNKEPMILEGVKHLIKCIENNTESISSGERAKEALRLALEYGGYMK